MPQPTSAPETPLLVACLCAQWCGTCNDYQAVFDSMRREFPQARFVWVDVEDHADLVDPIEVEDFPTLLIARGDSTQFFGTVTPQVETLKRMIQAMLDAPQAPTASAEVLAITARLQAWAP
jgi:thioredoxin 1